MNKSDEPLVQIDAHIHIASLYELCGDDIKKYFSENNVLVCSCAHTPKEYGIQKSIYDLFPHKIVQSYGIHPQLPDKGYLSFLENVLKSDAIDAIGEAGFDMFSDEYSVHYAVQKEVWYMQLEMAITTQKPLIVHCRRALNELFRDTALLKKVSALIFHSWSGSAVEAVSFLKRGVNAYFSLSKGLVNGNKRMIDTAQHIALERLLLETDAPFQHLKHEKITQLGDINAVYALLCQIRNLDHEYIEKTLAQTFYAIFSRMRKKASMDSL